MGSTSWAIKVATGRWTSKMTNRVFYQRLNYSSAHGIIKHCIFHLIHAFGSSGARDQFALHLFLITLPQIKPIGEQPGVFLTIQKLKKAVFTQRTFI